MKPNFKPRQIWSTIEGPGPPDRCNLNKDFPPIPPAKLVRFFFHFREFLEAARTTTVGKERESDHLRLLLLQSVILSLSFSVPTPPPTTTPRTHIVVQNCFLQKDSRCTCSMRDFHKESKSENKEKREEGESRKNGIGDFMDYPSFVQSLRIVSSSITYLVLLFVVRRTTALKDMGSLSWNVRLAIEWVNDGEWDGSKATRA